MAFGGGGGFTANQVTIYYESEGVMGSFPILHLKGTKQNILLVHHRLKLNSGCKCYLTTANYVIKI